MGKKAFWLDTETTGIDPCKASIIQLAGIIEIEGKLVEEINIKMQPFAGADVSQEALAVNHTTVEAISKYQPFEKGMAKLKVTLDGYVNTYDKTDKMIIMGYKVGFDSDFLREAFRRLGGDNAKYGYGSRFVSGLLVDVSSLVGIYVLQTGVYLKNHKLQTVCDHFKIPLDAHDALEDIKATRILYGKLLNAINGSGNVAQTTKVPDSADDVVKQVIETFGPQVTLKVDRKGIEDTVRDTISTVKKKMEERKVADKKPVQTRMF